MKAMEIDKETIDKKHFMTIQSHFNRVTNATKKTDFTLQVYGVYSLPHDYARMVEATPEYITQIILSDAVISDGKYNIKQLTEEEKKAEEEKKIKKPPPKGKEVEPTAEEKERIERERLEKEEKQRKFQAKIDAMSELERFYFFKEDPTREPFLTFGKNIDTVEKKDKTLIDLDEDINTHKGFFLQFNKIQNPDIDPKKLKPPPKGALPEDLKPINAISWVNLSEFLIPGTSEVIQRCPLMLKETYEKGVELNHHHGNEEVNTSKQGEESSHDLFQQVKTYVYLKITINPPVNPAIRERFPSPNDFIHREDKIYKQITSDDIVDDFRKQLKIFFEMICKSYEVYSGDSNKNQINNKKSDKVNVISNVRKEERDKNINQFLLIFNNGGKADLIKDRLKRFIIRIIREKYKKKEDIQSLFKESKDKFYSELFAYLSDEVKLAMDEYVMLKKELNDDIKSSYDDSRKESLQYAARVAKEPEELKLKNLSREYEIMGVMEKSYFYFKARLTLNSSKSSWITFAQLAKKMNRIIDCEEAINNCINADPDDLELKILYASVKYLKGRLNDSINYLTNIISNIGMKGTTYNFNLILAFFYFEKGNDLMYKKHMEITKRQKLIEMLGYNPGQRKRDKKEKKTALPPEKLNEMYYNLIKIFNDYHFYEISDKLIQFITTKNTSRYMIEEAKILLFKKDYKAVIKLTNEIIQADPTKYEAYVLCGNAYYFQNNLFDSEEAYVKAIRNKQSGFDSQMLYRLGITYIKRKTWEDAKVVFSKLIKDNYGFAWRYLGLAYTRLGDYEFAEEALNEAILIDIDNAEVWGYLTLFSLVTGRKPQALECLIEMNKVGFNEISILTEIGNMFNKTYNDYTIASEIYNKILKMDPKNIDVTCDLAYIYFLKLDKKQEGVNMILDCLKEATEERNKVKLQTKLNELYNQSGDKQFLEDGENRDDFFEDSQGD